MNFKKQTEIIVMFHLHQVTPIYNKYVLTQNMILGKYCFLWLLLI